MKLTWAGQVTNAVQTEILLESGLRAVIPTDSAYQVNGTAIARAAATGAVQQWNFNATVNNIAGTVSFSATPTISQTTVGAWDLAIAADNTYKALIPKLTGDGATININISADVVAVGADAPVLPGATDIVTLAQIKDYLKESTTDNDDVLQDWIIGISDLIEARLGQPVVARVVEDLIDGSGETKLYLNKGRIVDLLPDSITGSKLDSIQYRASALGAWSQLVEDINLVHLNPVNNWCVELLDYRIFPVGWKNIRLYFNCGFSPVPGDITKMALEMVKVMWDESNNGTRARLGLASTNISGAGVSGTDSYADIDTQRWQKTIDRYRRLL